MQFLFQEAYIAAPYRFLKQLVSRIRTRRNLILGLGSYVHPTAQILGVANTIIGANTFISEFSWLNVNHRTPGELAIMIGNNCWVGRNNFFTSGKAIHISDYFLSAIGCKFISSSHIVDDPLTPYMVSGTTSHQSIRIGVNCFFGAGSTVLGNVSIGHGSIVAADALVLNDLPPFCIASGNPAKVIKKYSFRENKWCDVSSFDESDSLLEPNEEAYLRQLRELHVCIAMPKVAVGSDFGNI
jgi:acetyltransferase-like isoleucine patch superfamily enzyme